MSLALVGCNAIAGIEPAQPACLDDEVKSGLETDIDCGGPCRPCPDAASCSEDTDCRSLACEDGACQIPRCWDGRKNGLETDVDCGGPSSLYRPCPRCWGEAECLDAIDCASLQCEPDGEIMRCRPSCCAGDCLGCEEFCINDCCETEGACCTDDSCGDGFPGAECDPENLASCVAPFICIELACR